MKLIALMSAAAVAAVALAPVPALADHHGGWKWKTVCKTSWHHGHKTRECHKQRVRW
jgi:Spy/CpxP family protein refolding chaperone